MRPGKWKVMYDDGGQYKEARKVGKRAWQVLEVIDFWEACGKEGQHYGAEVNLIDLGTVSEDVMRQARQSCGWESMPDNDEAKVEMLDNYGAHCPLGQCGGSSRRKVWREMRVEANAALDPDKLEELLDRPVNALGSTAREYAAGDIFSAMQRGCEAGAPNARIMAKMYGVDDYIIDDARPADWLPFLAGYSEALAGAPKMEQTTEGGGIVPEYYRGYERGERVKRGECPAPGWIKTAKTG